MYEPMSINKARSMAARFKAGEETGDALKAEGLSQSEFTAWLTQADLHGTQEERRVVFDVTLALYEHSRPKPRKKKS